MPILDSISCVFNPPPLPTAFLKIRLYPKSGKEVDFRLNRITFGKQASKLASSLWPATLLNICFSNGVSNVLLHQPRIAKYVSKPEHSEMNIVYRY